MCFNYKCSRCKNTFTGTPVRKDFYNHQELPEWAPSGDGALIFVMGVKKLLLSIYQ